jgi:hypothetical protein
VSVNLKYNKIPRKKSILIIKSATQKITTTERFLFQRGWNVKIVEDSVTEGLKLVGNFQPEYLFVSTAVIDSEFSVLYAALKKSFKVILFNEKQNAHAIQVVRDIAPIYCLQGPISGPTIERMIHHIQTSSPSEKLTPFDSEKMDIDRMTNAAEYVLDTYCDRYDEPKNPLGPCRAFHYFTVNTGKLSGYFVVAASGAPNQQLLGNIREGITKYMERTGQFFDAGDIKEIELREVQFESLAMASGEFFRKSAHLEDEIAVAFFRRPESEFKVEVSTYPGDWVTTELGNIVSGERVDFDIFVYLPVNNRFILYKRAGDPMEEQQRSKLIRGGIKHVHFRREEVPLIDSYQARTYLNSLIFQFNEDLTEAQTAS